jgi:cytochrome oxidase Cu insertion factor (SCO1/SenC/PrrC family)
MNDYIRLTMSRYTAAALFVFLAAAAHSGSTSTAGAQGLIGAVYTPPVPAADFTLTDQHGTPFHMADMAGKVVVFCFIYTHCADTCPYISLKVKTVYGMLGTDAARVEFVAVTTDPQRDTPEVIARYSREAGLFDIWHFVTGPIAEVSLVWSRYLANAAAGGTQTTGDTGGAQTGDAGGGAAAAADSAEHGQGLGADDLALARRIISGFGGGYEVSHFAAFHVIDRRGRIRVTLDQDALPREILANVRTLLAER